MILDKQKGQCYNMLWICAQKCAMIRFIDSNAKLFDGFCVCNKHYIFQRRRKKENANV